MTSRDAGAPSRAEAEFGSIDGAHEYVARLLRVVEDTAQDVGEDLRRTVGGRGRRREALQLAAYKLEQLRLHLSASRRRLGELDALRRIVDGEGTAIPVSA